VALGLAAFLALAVGVVARRSVGIAQARTIDELDRSRAQLEARGIALRGEIREAVGRSRLGAIAERRLGMRLPADSMVILLPVPAGDRRAP
jgi:hypothetical protein